MTSATIGGLYLGERPELLLPTYGTRPTPGALSDIRAIEATGRLLGTPLIPWQRYAARVATERHPLDPRRYRYRTVVITVPRQSGKTTLMRAVNVERTIRVRDHLALYTAQTGKDARDRFKDLIKQVKRSPLEHFYHERKSAGDTALEWPNGSEFKVFAPTSASIHGSTPGTVMCDECWEYDEAQGEDLTGAIEPAQQTLVDRQSWWVSTMGDAASTWWHALTADGRASIDDPESDICYIEYSAPEGSDLYAPETWRAFHPGLGHLITEEDLRGYANSPKISAGTWRRAFMNRPSSATETLIDLEAWATMGRPDLAANPRHVVLTFDVAFDRSQATIVASWRVEAGLDAGKVATRVVRTGAGTRWLAPAVASLRNEWDVKTVGADYGGPTREVVDSLRSAGVELSTLDGATFATSTGALLGHVAAGDQLVHAGDVTIADEWRAAITRPLGDSVAFSRRHSRGPISGLVATSVGVRLVEHGGEPEQQPYVYRPEDDADTP